MDSRTLTCWFAGVRWGCARMKLSSRPAAGDGGFLLLPVGDEDLVCPFGLLGGLAFLVAALFAAVCRRGLAAAALPGWVSGGELELASFVRDQAGAGEGVVFVAGREVPGQHGQLPGGGDDGGLVAAPCVDPLVEGAQ